MKRRDFTKGLAALAVLPALPARGTAAAAAGAVSASEPLYIWADLITRAHNRASPQMLSRLLRVDAGTGARLFAQLQANGAVTAPDAFGISRAAKPLFQQYATVTGHGPAATPKPMKINQLSELSDTPDPPRDDNTALPGAPENDDNPKAEAPDPPVDFTKD